MKLQKFRETTSQQRLFEKEVDKKAVATTAADTTPKIIVAKTVNPAEPPQKYVMCPYMDRPRRVTVSACLWHIQMSDKECQRLECSRYKAVRNINIKKQYSDSNNHSTTAQPAHKNNKK